MMSLRCFLLLLFFALLFSSCKKDELPVPAHDPGDVTTSTVNMESTYKWQLYFDLKTNTVVGQNEKTTWDLGFETSANGFKVVLNTSKAMFAWNTEDTSFVGITDTSGFEANKNWDETSGTLDSTAIGDWRNTNQVYIIDRGYDGNGTHQGFRKIQFLSYDSDSYSVRFAQLNGTGETILQIDKDTVYNFSFLSFTSGNTLLVEPPKTAWDIVFTQYTHIFYDATITPYLVTGCLLNRYNTAARLDSGISFPAIDLSLAQSYQLSSAVNSIGYEWKTYAGGVYVTNPQMNYIIRDSEGFFYKLHFIDFYNQSGVKGNPKWEYQEL